jgi:2-polyprenyl-3-methyl-5-hydroxy-6-metoxy-1,4-benzoquinol methylase
MKIDGEAPSGEKRCIVCGSIQSELFLIKTHDGRGPGPISLLKCDVCKVVFLGSWSEAYDSHLYDYYNKRKSVNKVDIYSPITEIRYKELLAFFRGISPGNRMLDVGCGQGHFVDVALRGGWDVLGIELSKPAVAICQKFGLPVERIDFFSTTLEEGSFDFLTMFEVIEHVSSPSKFAQRAEKLLRPGGVLYLTTPNFDSLDRRLLGASWHVIHREHLTYFTPETMRGLISTSSNLSIEYLQTRNLSLSALGSLLRGRTRELESPGPVVEESASMYDADKGEVMRSRIESSRILKELKSITNKVLNSVALGADMSVLCRKPA